MAKNIFWPFWSKKATGPALPVDQKNQKNSQGLLGPIAQVSRVSTNLKKIRVPAGSSLIAPNPLALDLALVLALAAPVCNHSSVGLSQPLVRLRDQL